MPSQLATSARGALAGVIATGIWSVQTPLDMRVFGVHYRDEELLGKAVTRGPAWPAVGAALHLLNGAAFGAAYATVAPRLPLPPWARGPAVGLAEHVATWPLAVVIDHVHPARDELPPLAGNLRAFLQSAWRHALFGFVLGELERRLNAATQEPTASVEDIASSNGHGNIEHAVGAAGP